MKKFITLAIVLTTITLSSFASNISGVSQKVLSSFKRSYHSAEVVRWELKNNLYKVTFKSADKEMYAYYNADGDQIAVTRNIHIDQLPISLAAELKKKYKDSWLTDLFEVSANGESAYYATMECSTHIITLKAEGTTGWATFNKEKRK